MKVERIPYMTNRIVLNVLHKIEHFRTTIYYVPQLTNSTTYYGIVKINATAGSAVVAGPVL